MTLDTLPYFAKIFALILTTFTIYRTFVGLLSLKKDKLQKDFEFAEKFINEDLDSIHDFKLELGYKGLTGKHLDVNILRYLLRQTNPTLKLYYYHLGKKFLSIIERDANIKILFTNKLNTPLKLKWMKFWYGGLYFLYVALGFLPWIYYRILNARALTSAEKLKNLL